ncbi:MAG: YraN family protein [Proteobacteria bacterium]|nr:YraN family protein [Pseudomonadota bacterium]
MEARRGHSKGAGVEDRRRRLRRGWTSEILASLALMAKGYRILARRHRTPYGEVDLIAVRGRRLAFVEVKHRATMPDAEAALTPHQAGRMARAADHWIAHRRAYQQHDVGLDAMLVVPWTWPRHLPDSMGGL